MSNIHLLHHSLFITSCMFKKQDATHKCMCHNTTLKAHLSTNVKSEPMLLNRQTKMFLSTFVLYYKLGLVELE